MAVAGKNERAADTWSGILTDAVAKCGRSSERKLYLYGISSNRCVNCRARLQPGNDTCVNCNQRQKTPRKCTHCSQKNNLAMWCAMCDAYFCAICYKKPHALILGSTKPHQCFPIDDASGKHFVVAAWSEEFTAMLQRNYRLRFIEKTQADQVATKAPTQATGQLAAPVVDEAVESTATTTTLLKQPQLPAEGSPDAAEVDDAAGDSSAPAPAGDSSTSASAATPSSDLRPNTQEPSRKRQLVDVDDTRDRIQKWIRGAEPSHAGGRAAVTPISTQIPALTDGMTLYDRVKEMHDKRARAAQSNVPHARSPKTGFNRLLSRKEEHQQEQNEQEKQGPDHVPQHQQQEQEQAELSRIEQQRLDHLESLRTQKQQENEQLQKEQEKQRRQADEQRWQANQLQQEKRKQGVLRQQEQLQERQRQQQLMEERMQHEQILRQQDKTRSLMPEGSQFTCHAQYVLQAQSGYASMAQSNISTPMPSIPVASMASSRISALMPSMPVASMASSSISAPMPSTMAPLSVSALMPSSAHYTQVLSSAAASHASRFESAAPSSQIYTFPSNLGASAVNDHVYQKHTAAPQSRFKTISQDREGNCNVVVRDPNIQQEQQQQTDFPDAMVPHQITTGAEGDFIPSKSGEDDELRAIWVNDYDNVNALVMQLEMEITKRTEEGHSFVHMSNNITIPEQLKLQLSNLRAQRNVATKKRFKSLARVLIFSNVVRSFAQQNEHSNIWSDVPEVLKSSHKKCAELAAKIRASEQQAQKFRERIDEAVSSGDPVQMQNVARLGALIADLERKIHISNCERDKQFTFMFQFSATLRNMVRAEWAATGRDHQMQSNP